MTYLGELRANARSLFAASIGVGMGVYLMSYVSSIFSPYLVKEFGWAREQFALLGLVSISATLVTPFIGRAADKFGSRPIAMIGVIGIPAVFVACSQMNGNFYMFAGLMIALLTLGVAASPVVYTRVVAQRMTRARGLALTIIMMAPAIFGAVGSPLLNEFILEHGWRTAYLVTAAILAVGGGLALTLLPPEQRDRSKAARAPKVPVGYGKLLRTPAFWLIFLGLMLSTLPTTVHTSQANLMLLDNHLSPAVAVGMISTFAVGTIVGRLLCGVALDWLPAHLVAAISMGLPAVGLAILASSWDAPVVIAVSMFLVGLSYGAEGDVVAYLVARWFRVEIYSSVLGLMFAGVSGATALGAVILSATLRQTHSYALFLGITACTVLIGSLLLFLLGRQPPAVDPAEAAAELAADPFH